MINEGDGMKVFLSTVFNQLTGLDEVRPKALLRANEEMV